MMLPTFFALLAAVSATPISIPNIELAGVVTRQLISDRTSLTENQFSRRIGGGCRDVIFVWARGSTELGNMVFLQKIQSMYDLTLHSGVHYWPATW
jgi:cutinase